MGDITWSGPRIASDPDSRVTPRLGGYLSQPKGVDADGDVSPTTHYPIEVQRGLGHVWTRDCFQPKEGAVVDFLYLQVSGSWQLYKFLAVSVFSY